MGSENCKLLKFRLGDWPLPALASPELLQSISPQLSNALNQLLLKKYQKDFCGRHYCIADDSLDKSKSVLEENTGSISVILSSFTLLFLAK